MRLALFVSIILMSALSGQAYAAPDLSRAHELVYKRDYADALTIIKPQADAGNAEAQYLLGGLHKFGNGVPKDRKEMARLYQAAADKGFVGAQIATADMYATGEDVEQNYATAIKYFRMAANQRSSSGAVALAGAYETGTGVSKDLVLAYKWMLLAERFDTRASRNSMELMLKTREELRALLNNDEAMRAEQMVQDWKPEAR